MNESSPQMFSRRAKHFFIWLSGAGAESLAQCPSWEQRKYVAFGATVLVPTVFALIAATYAVSTLTSNPAIIIPIALAWAFIILSIDRALLATYRAFQPKGRKLTQFGLRFMIAMLMGLTISHPLALLLFQDRISAQIETERGEEIQHVRAKIAANLAEQEKLIAANEASLADNRAALQKTFETNFLDPGQGDSVVKVQTVLVDEEATAAMEGRITAAITPMKERITQIDGEMEKTQAEYTKLKEELDHWQREFEREVNGQRSGIVGVGPRAKSIQTDQLEWRRTEAKRLANTIDFLTSQRNELSRSITATDEEIRGEYAAAAAARQAELKAERERVAAMKLQAQEAQMDEYLVQQVSVRDGLEQEIAGNLDERKRLQDQIALISADGNARIADLRDESRRDLLTQTLALHSLFGSGTEGGFFALSAYLVLTLLFLTVDTIPIVVKFFSPPGPYDNVVKLNEECYARSSQTYDYATAPEIDFELSPELGFGQLITRKSSFERYIDLEREKLVNLSENESKVRAATLNDMESRFNYALAKLITAQLTPPDQQPLPAIAQIGAPATAPNGHHPQPAPLSPNGNSRQVNSNGGYLPPAEPATAPSHQVQHGKLSDATDQVRTMRPPSEDRQV